MKPWYTESQIFKKVEAIEDGKIVLVSESYAIREGLLIVRRIASETPSRKKTEEVRPLMDDFRKPLKPKINQVTKELVDNFHWYISKRRRHLEMTRKQLAEKINETEETIKLIENGILPNNDFILINKIQNFLNINLRKDNQDFSQSPRKLIPKDKESRLPSTNEKENILLGEEIDV